MDSRHMHSPAFATLNVQQLDCILAAGEMSDLDSLREWCATLPEQSYGQIFIEALSADEVQTLEVPAGVNVTWILRDRPHHRPHANGDCAIRAGQALSRAVDAWLDEWVRIDSSSVRNFMFWVGARSNPLMTEFWHRVEDEFAAIRAGKPVTQA